MRRGTKLKATTGEKHARDVPKIEKKGRSTKRKKKALALRSRHWAAKKKYRRERPKTRYSAVNV